MDLVRIRTIADVIYVEGFRRLPKPLHKVAVGAVIKNPFAGRYVEDLSELYQTGAELGALLGETAVAQLAGEPHSYGKAAIVGMNGELEHAAAPDAPDLGRAPARNSRWRRGNYPIGKENRRTRHGNRRASAPQRRHVCTLSF